MPAGMTKVLIAEENYKDLAGKVKGIEIIPINFINKAYSRVFKFIPEGILISKRPKPALLTPSDPSATINWLIK